MAQHGRDGQHGQESGFHPSRGEKKDERYKPSGIGSWYGTGDYSSSSIVHGYAPFPKRPRYGSMSEEQYGSNPYVNRELGGFSSADARSQFSQQDFNFGLYTDFSSIAEKDVSLKGEKKESKPRDSRETSKLSLEQPSYSGRHSERGSNVSETSTPSKHPPASSTSSFPMTPNKRRASVSQDSAQPQSTSSTWRSPLPSPKPYGSGHASISKSGGVRNDPRQEMTGDFRGDLRVDPRDLRPDLRQDIKTDSKLDLRGDSKGDFRSDVKASEIQRVKWLSQSSPWPMGTLHPEGYKQDPSVFTKQPSPRRASLGTPQLDPPALTDSRSEDPSRARLHHLSTFWQSYSYPPEIWGRSPLQRLPVPETCPVLRHEAGKSTGQRTVFKNDSRSEIKISTRTDKNDPIAKSRGDAWGDGKAEISTRTDKSDIRSKSRSDTWGEYNSDSKVDPVSSLISDIKTESRPDLKSESENVIRVDPRSEFQMELKFDGISHIKSDAESQLKVDMKKDPQGEFWSDTKSEKSDFRDDFRTDARKESQKSKAFFQSSLPGSFSFGSAQAECYPKRKSSAEKERGMDSELEKRVESVKSGIQIQDQTKSKGTVGKESDIVSSVLGLKEPKLEPPRDMTSSIAEQVKTGESSIESQEEILAKMDKMDKEIQECEQNIENLKVKEIKLEESLENFLKESALLEKVKEEPQDTDEEENQGKDELIDRLIERFRPRNYELIKKIYDDNKAKAAKAHSKLDKLNFNELPSSSVPLYNQPSDLPFYYENIKKHQMFRGKLINFLRIRKLADIQQEKNLKEQYGKLHQIWSKKLEKHENNAKRKLKTSKARTFYEREFPEIKRQREHQERMNRLGSRSTWGAFARSEAEFEEIVDNLTELEANQRQMHLLAVQPPKLLSKYERRVKFINRNGLIRDIVKFERERRYLNVWTDEEKRIFREKFNQYPKDFETIASFLERKSVSNCVLYYYQNKKKDNLKSSSKKSGKKGRLQKQFGTGDYNQAKSRGKEKSGLLISFGFEDDEESRISAGDEESAGIPISKSISVVPVVPPVIQPEMHSAEPQTKDMKQLAQAQLQPKESRLLSVDELIAKHVARKSLPAENVDPSRWSEIEISNAVEGLKRYGRNWAAIAKLVHTKSEAQCKNFYFNYKRKFHLESILGIAKEDEYCSRDHFSQPPPHPPSRQLHQHPPDDTEPKPKQEIELRLRSGRGRSTRSKSSTESVETNADKTTEQPEVERTSVPQMTSEHISIVQEVIQKERDKNETDEVVITKTQGKYEVKSAVSDVEVKTILRRCPTPVEEKEQDKTEDTTDKEQPSVENESSNEDQEQPEVENAEPTMDVKSDSVDDMSKISTEQLDAPLANEMEHESITDAEMENEQLKKRDDQLASSKTQPFNVDLDLSQTGSRSSTPVLQPPPPLTPVTSTPSDLTGQKAFDTCSPTSPVLQGISLQGHIGDFKKMLDKSIVASNHMTKSQSKESIDTPPSQSTLTFEPARARLHELAKSASSPGPPALTKHVQPTSSPHPVSSVSDRSCLEQNAAIQAFSHKHASLMAAHPHSCKSLVPPQPSSEVVVSSHMRSTPRVVHTGQIRTSLETGTNVSKSTLEHERSGSARPIAESATLGHIRAPVERGLDLNRTVYESRRPHSRPGSAGVPHPLPAHAIALHSPSLPPPHPFSPDVLTSQHNFPYPHPHHHPHFPGVNIPSPHMLPHGHYPYIDDRGMMQIYGAEGRPGQDFPARLPLRNIPPEHALLSEAMREHLRASTEGRPEHERSMRFGEQLPLFFPHHPLSPMDDRGHSPFSSQSPVGRQPLTPDEMHFPLKGAIQRPRTRSEMFERAASIPELLSDGHRPSSAPHALTKRRSLENLGPAAALEHAIAERDQRNIAEVGSCKQLRHSPGSMPQRRPSSGSQLQHPKEMFGLEALMNAAASRASSKERPEAELSRGYLQSGAVNPNIRMNTHSPLELSQKLLPSSGPIHPTKQQMSGIPYTSIESSSAQRYGISTGLVPKASRLTSITGSQLSGDKTVSQPVSQHGGSESHLEHQSLPKASSLSSLVKCKDVIRNMEEHRLSHELLSRKSFSKTAVISPLLEKQLSQPLQKAASGKSPTAVTSICQIRPESPLIVSATSLASLAQRENAVAGEPTSNKVEVSAGKKKKQTVFRPWMDSEENKEDVLKERTKSSVIAKRSGTFSPFDPCLVDPAAAEKRADSFGFPAQSLGSQPISTSVRHMFAHQDQSCPSVPAQGRPLQEDRTVLRMYTEDSKRTNTASNNVSITYSESTTSNTSNIPPNMNQRNLPFHSSGAPTRQLSSSFSSKKDKVSILEPLTIQCPSNIEVDEDLLSPVFAYQTTASKESSCETLLSDSLPSATEADKRVTDDTEIIDQSASQRNIAFQFPSSLRQQHSGSVFRTFSPLAQVNPRFNESFEFTPTELEGRERSDSETLSADEGDRGFDLDSDDNQVPERGKEYQSVQDTSTLRTTNSQPVINMDINIQPQPVINVDIQVETKSNSRQSDVPSDRNSMKFLAATKDVTPATATPLATRETAGMSPPPNLSSSTVATAVQLETQSVPDSSVVNPVITINTDNASVLGGKANLNQQKRQEKKKTKGSKPKGVKSKGDKTKDEMPKADNSKGKSKASKSTKKKSKKEANKPTILSDGSNVTTNATTKPDTGTLEKQVIHPVGSTQDNTVEITSVTLSAFPVEKQAKEPIKSPQDSTVKTNVTPLSTFSSNSDFVRNFFRELDETSTGILSKDEQAVINSNVETFVAENESSNINIVPMATISTNKGMTRIIHSKDHTNELQSKPTDIFLKATNSKSPLAISEIEQPTTSSYTFAEAGMTLPPATGPSQQVDPFNSQALAQLVRKATSELVPSPPTVASLLLDTEGQQQGSRVRSKPKTSKKTRKARSVNERQKELFGAITKKLILTETEQQCKNPFKPEDEAPFEGDPTRQISDVISPSIINPEVEGIKNDSSENFETSSSPDSGNQPGFETISPPASPVCLDEPSSLTEDMPPQSDMPSSFPVSALSMSFSHSTLGSPPSSHLPVVAFPYSTLSLNVGSRPASRSGSRPGSLSGSACASPLYTGPGSGSPSGVQGTATSGTVTFSPEEEFITSRLTAVGSSDNIVFSIDDANLESENMDRVARTISSSKLCPLTDPASCSNFSPYQSTVSMTSVEFPPVSASSREQRERKMSMTYEPLSDEDEYEETEAQSDDEY